MKHHNHHKNLLKILVRAVESVVNMNGEVRSAILKFLLGGRDNWGSGIDGIVVVVVSIHFKHTRFVPYL